MLTQKIPQHVNIIFANFKQNLQKKQIYFKLREKQIKKKKKNLKKSG